MRLDGKSQLFQQLLRPRRMGRAVSWRVVARDLDEFGKNAVSRAKFCATNASMCFAISMAGARCCGPRPLSKAPALEDVMALLPW